MRLQETVPEKIIHVLSLCHHGVTESWARKQSLEEALATANGKKNNATVEIICRGIDPQYKKPDREGRGRRVTIEEIQTANVIFLHQKHVLAFRRVFGEELLTHLLAMQKLIIVGGVEDRERTTVATRRLHQKSTGRSVDTIAKALKKRTDCYRRKILGVLKNETRPVTNPVILVDAAEKAARYYENKKPKRKK